MEDETMEAEMQKRIDRVALDDPSLVVSSMRMFFPSCIFV
jgi:hypothetical protein